MLSVLNLGSGVNSSDPELQYAYYDNNTGILADPFALEFQIFDIADATKQITPVQIFPATPGNWESVDLVNDKLSTGRFYADWDGTGGVATGKHKIVWRVTPESGDTPLESTHIFDIVPATEMIPNGYCTISDMRAEGVTATLADDLKVAQSIEIASRFIERITHRTFGPTYKTVRLNGKGGPMVLSMEVIIAIESVLIDTDPFFTSIPEALENDLYRVYNRHLSQNLRSPDDRNNPKLEIRTYLADLTTATGMPINNINVSKLVFPKGQQNIQLKGIFGYTDYDGTPLGRVPLEIRSVCKKIAFRELPTLMDFDSRTTFNKAFLVTREQTRHQRIHYFDRLAGRSQTAVFGMFTGDAEIDNVLAAYVRPPAIGVV